MHLEFGNVVVDAIRKTIVDVSCKHVKDKLNKFLNKFKVNSKGLKSYCGSYYVTHKNVYDSAFAKVLDKVHDTKHPELEKEREAFVQKLKAEAVKSIKGKMDIIPGTAAKDKNNAVASFLSNSSIGDILNQFNEQKGKLISGISDTLASSFKIKSESLKKFLNGQIDKWGKKGLEKSIKSIFDMYNK